MAAKRLIILGSTGSIGTSTLSVVEAHQNLFRVVGLHAHTKKDELVRIGKSLGVKHLALSALPGPCEDVQYCGEDGLLSMISELDADIVVNGIAGAKGLMPSVAAIESGKDLALANKETIVMAGGLIRELSARKNVEIIPVDSEHAAVFSLRERIPMQNITEVVLTASGGAFRELPIKRLSTVKWQDALAHPTWEMGTKITIDSATMANKGLEIIEACELFQITEDRVRVLIHPQSCVHAMVSTIDGNMYAQLSQPDMRIPIQNALTYPAAANYMFDRLNLAGMNLSFQNPDANRYPCLGLARLAARSGGAYSIVYNAANEVAVQAFINGKIGFLDIPSIIKNCLDASWDNLLVSFEHVLDQDQKARKYAKTFAMV
ncbi:MAG: 1-deoxy-D-xylulose-5-phosphate reductoisomerase [Spirochaetales bacterium]|nr:1-deoxy-D-xylulose-5-phosphate reductoisomerase [Spirochaetales bacterium]